MRLPDAPPTAVAPAAYGADAAAAAAAMPVLQAVFFDGLTHVSLFIEPYQPQRHREAVQGRLGATGTLMARRDPHWITAVGDVPPATLQLFVDALQRRR
jgi:sigma-E factor negative regulatory protein RseB